MSATSLPCDHCGDSAIRSDSGLFADGVGDRCESCGFPGHVSADSESDPYWVCSEEHDAVCARKDCSECEETRDA